MDNLITYSAFVGEYNIPIKDTAIPDFNAYYIAKYQEEILAKLLGWDLYLKFETGLAEEAIAQKWIDLRDGSNYVVDGKTKRNKGVKEIIRNYTYCKWISSNYEQLTTLGVISSNSENASIVSPENKITNAWNDMIGIYYNVYEFLTNYEEDYPNLETEELRIMTYGF